VLRHENAVLRRHAGRVPYEPADRAWFAALAHFIPRGRWLGRCRGACHLRSARVARRAPGLSAASGGTTAAAGQCFSDMPSRSRGWQRDNGRVGCSRTQLDFMGHDPQPASR
jgi:hypothetical protein